MSLCPACWAIWGERRRRKWRRRVKEEGETRRGRSERETEEEKMEGKWSRSTWSGERQVIRDLIAGDQCSGKSAQSRCPAYIHIN